jgi:pimeloyl-ACP methyl ester carboxylesterase
MITEKVLETENHNIFYRMVGNGKPIFFVHGFGEDGTIWNDLIDHLKDQFQCIIPDLPGSGKSQMKKGIWSMEGFADSLRSIFIHEHISSSVLIGHSMGGYISLAFAEKYAELLKGFGLFHSSAFADNEEKKVTRRRGIEFIEEHGAARFLEQATPKLFSEDLKSKNTEIVQELIERFTNFEDSSLVHYYEAMMQRPDRTKVLENYSGPILFIMGEHDTAIPLADGLKQCHIPRLSYIHILRNSGHMGMIEETDKCGQILKKFLQELGTGDPGI